MKLKKYSGAGPDLYIPVIIIAIASFYLIILGQDGHVEIHDNLDSSHVWLTLLKENGLFFASSDALVPILSGMSRDYFMSEFQLANFLYYLFEPFDAHLVNFVLKLVLGFFSFRVLAGYILESGEEDKLLISLAALAYAFLPGYENLYIAQATLPLIVYFYLRFINKDNYVFLLGAFLYPVLSEFPRYGFFICSLVALSILYFLLFDRKYAFRAMLFLLALSLGYLITDYRLFRLMLWSGEETIRSEFLAAPAGFWRSLVLSLTQGQYHAQSKHLFVILPTILITSLLYLKSKFANSTSDMPMKTLATDPVIRIYAVFGLLILGFCGLYALYAGTNFNQYLSDYLGLLAGFNFSRFVWFNPLIWHLFFALVLILLCRRLGRWVSVSIASIHVLVVVFLPGYGSDIQKSISCSFYNSCQNVFSYEEFYSQELFSKIKSSIEYDGEKVVAFGFHPAIISYNGFFTADGYHNSYPLDYKYEFRRLIEPVLEKSSRFRSYFDNWGARAYIFSTQVSYAPKKDIPDMSVSLEMSASQSKSLGIKYIISFYPLNTNPKFSLEHLGLFQDARSPYNAHVYKIR